MLGRLYKAAISRGMSKHDYFHSTPNDIEIFIREYDSRKKSEIKIKTEEIEYSAWLNGLYVRLAVSSVLNGKKVKYPKKPLEKNEPQINIEVTEDMTENEKDKIREQFAENMRELFSVPKTLSDGS